MNKELYEKGMAVRRAVLGDAHVDKSLAAADDFSMPIQEFVTQYCWGDTWNRPGLDRRSRSMINLAMLTILNRPHEFKAHVRGAINNGLTKEDIREVLMHTAIYVGIPATLDSVRLAREVFKEMGMD
jgi:4-carboxymuconolactone decarboxylase